MKDQKRRLDRCNVLPSNWISLGSQTLPLAQWLSGRAPTSGAVGRWFEPWWRHTKGSKNGTSGYLAWCSAFLGLSFPNKYRKITTQNLPPPPPPPLPPASIKKSEKSPILINVCIHRRAVWKVMLNTLFSLKIEIIIISSNYYIKRDATYICKPPREKTNDLHMRRQRRRSASRYQRLCFRFLDSTIPLLPKYKISSL